MQHLICNCCEKAGILRHKKCYATCWDKEGNMRHLICNLLQ
jgi:hypothetical protein